MHVSNRFLSPSEILINEQAEVLVFDCTFSYARYVS